MDRIAAPSLVLGLVLGLTSCAGAPAITDSGPRDRGDAAIEGDAGARDASSVDASPRDASALDAWTEPDAGPPSLDGLRDRLIATLGDAPCATWASFDASRRAVFLTLTHRLFVSHTPDGLPMLAHVTRIYLVLGGGSSGDSCGGAENNRLFLATDPYLHEQLVLAWTGTSAITDGDGTSWIHTRDSAGPHDPFDASDETDTGLRCALLFETSGSRPPTAQAHFFLDGSAVPVERGSGISLPADPLMMEIDQDYDCIHDSNPTCFDFEDRYRENHGDFGCEWVPSSCVATETGCYPGIAAP